ncbi:MAG: GvpL/GvpF family gas vesicle protein [Acidobacteriia bacterium]|nr:GvpL/GvpF family gas vesicle protein [Terriglobia bacterium]
MAWYAYCITEQHAFSTNGAHARRPFPIPGMKGIAGATVLAYPSGDFAVIASEYERSGALDQTSVLEHARVVSECFRNTTVLPFKFGTVFDSDEALRRAVRANRKAFTESVARLKGKSEMHLKVVVHSLSARDLLPDATLPLAAGSEYLCKLREIASRDRERQSKARAVSVQVHKLFLPLEEEVSCKRVDSGGLLIDIAHLIDSKAVEKYQNRYSAATRQLKNCRVAISGPWPPYHFTPGKLRTVGSNS